MKIISKQSFIILLTAIPVFILCYHLADFINQILIDRIGALKANRSAWPALAYIPAVIWFGFIVYFYYKKLK